MAGCSLNKIKSDVKNKMDGFIKEVDSTIPFNAVGNPVIRDMESIPKIKTKIEDWSQETFGKRYEGQWFIEQERYGNTVLHPRFPKELERGYEVKLKETPVESERNSNLNSVNLSQDADYSLKVISVTPPSPPKTKSPDGYKYSAFLNEQTIFRNKLNQRIQVLQEMEDQSESVVKETLRLKRIEKSVNTEIQYLKKNSVKLKNMFTHFETGLKNIENMIHENPTQDSLYLAREYIDSLDVILRDTGDIDKKFSEKFYQDIEDKDIVALFSAFSARKNAVNDSLENAERKAAVDLVQSVLGEEMTEQEAIEKESKEFLDEIEKGGTMGNLSYWFQAMDTNKSSSPILRAIMRLYNYSTGKKHTEVLERALTNIQKALESELIKLGHYTKNIIGTKKAKYSNIFKRIDANGNYRLVGKFSEKWDVVESMYKGTLLRVRRMDTFSKGTKLEISEKKNKARGNLFNNLHKKKMMFLDVGGLPEIIKDSRFNKFSSDFKSYQEAEDYKKKVLNILIGITAKDFNKLPTEEQAIKKESALLQYEKIIEEQKEKILHYSLELDNQMDEAMKNSNVSSPRDITAESQDEILDFIARNSPFEFSKQYEKAKNSSVDRLSVIPGAKKTKVNSSLEYSTFIPTTTDFFSEDFQKNIENNPIFYKAWKIFREGYSFNNKNRKYRRNETTESFEDSITSKDKVILDHISSIKDLLYGLAKKIPKGLSQWLLAQPFVAQKNLSLGDSISSVNEDVQGIIDAKTEAMKLMGMKPYETYNKLIQKSSAADMRTLRGLVNFTSTNKNQNIKTLIRKQAVTEYAMQQDDNMVESLKTQLPIVGLFKARKEVEVKLLFLKNMFKKLSKNTDSDSHRRQEEMIDTFLRQDLYGVQNRKFLSRSEEKKEKEGIKLKVNKNVALIKANRELIGLIDKKIADLATQNLSKPQYAASYNRLTKLKNDINRGKEHSTMLLTWGSGLEGFLLKTLILSGMGWNYSSQAINYFIGNLNTKMADGVFWKSGNADKAKKFLSKYKVVARYVGKLTHTQKEEIYAHNLSNIFLNTIGIFQNAANEVDTDISNNDIKPGSLLSYRGPFYLIGQVEKTIQRPQIISMLADIKIKDKKGKLHPLFDLDYEPGSKDHPTPHPGFVIGPDGGIALHPDFETKENIKTWIKKTSKEYVSIFSESGSIPNVIYRLNGDFRTSSTIMAKQRLIGAFAMAFKTWVAAAVDLKYGEDGYYTTLQKGGHGGKLLTLLSMQKATYALSALYTYSPGLAGLAHVAIYGRHKYLEGMKKDITLMQQLGVKINSLFNVMGFTDGRFSGRDLANNIGRGAKGSGGFAAGIGLKFLQGVTGKEMLTDAKINKFLFANGKTEFETDEQFEMNKAKLQGLIIEFRRTATLTAFRAGIYMLYQALTAPDDDDEYLMKYMTLTEREEYLKKMEEENRWISNIYYAAENTATQTLDDTNWLQDPIETAKVTLQGNNTTMFDGVKSILSTWGDGSPVYLAGDNIGTSKVEVAFGKMFANKLYSGGFRFYSETFEQDITIPTGGWSVLMRRDYRPGDYISQKDITDKVAFTRGKKLMFEEAKGLIRLETIAEYKGTGVSTEDLNEDVNARIKAYKEKMTTISGKSFTPSGEFINNMGTQFEYRDLIEYMELEFDDDGKIIKDF